MAEYAGDDEPLFDDDAPVPGAGVDDEPRWPLLIVDDEPEVHAVTKLAVADLEFAGRRLECLSAYSGREARERLRERRDVAVVLLDVVMETDHEGLDVAQFIRRELDNQLVRIILRTGNPGQAPALRVIRDYDINDYKEKSELTAEKLISAVYTGLRSYRDLAALERNRRGLQTVLEVSGGIFSERSMERFAAGVLEQLTALLYLDRDALVLRTSALAAQRQGQAFQVLAGTGRFESITGQITTDTLHPTVRDRIHAGLETRANVYAEDYFTAYFRMPDGAEQILYISGTHPITAPDRDLIELFARNVGIAGENLRLTRELERSQRDLVFILSEAIEKRSRETGNHVRRVAEYVQLLATAYGLPEQEAMMLSLAASLHDTGKIAIPDSVLNKPGIHDDQERAVMRTHASVGARILDGYDQPLLDMAAIIASQHHEHWDGSGYPAGLMGHDIHLYGRICAIADVFDALGSDRCYKQAWDVDKVFDYIRDQSGKQFDPHLAELFLDQKPDVLDIRARYPDDFSGS